MRLLSITVILSGNLRLKVLNIKTLRLRNLKHCIFVFLLLSFICETKANGNLYGITTGRLMNDTITNGNEENDTIPRIPTDGRRPRGRQVGDTIVTLPAPPEIIEESPKEEDKVKDTVETRRRREKQERDFSEHSPTRAAMLSAALPGAGQIYNRKYWKVPIIYAGFGAVVYYANAYNTEYQKWRKAYTYRVDGNPNTVDDYPDFSEDYLRRAMNYFRRNLELTYIAGGFIYLLGILDATVDAHLLDFDVSEDLTLKLKPALIPSAASIGYGRYSTGLTLSFNF